MRVLVAPDKFKGTLTARTAAMAIAHGWRRACPDDELELLPISDGGDGFGSVLATLQSARPAKTVTVDAAGRRCVVSWWWNVASRTAIIESARVIGLAMLPRGKFHPFDLDTRGLAVLLRAAASRGARRCLVGIGGSATNDGGYGLACGLGWKFWDRQGRHIGQWTDLTGLARIERPQERSWPGRIVVAVDVQNRLLGRHGCTRVYGPQKGLQPGDFAKAEAALRRLAKVVGEELGDDFAPKPGAGAAGGLGFGLAAFTGASLKPGFDLVADAARLDAKIRRADLVITGEGRIDRSTLMGKGVGELAARCRKFEVPCLALAGCLADRKVLAKHFSLVAALTELTSPERAQADAKYWLGKLAAVAASRCLAPAES